MASIRQRQRQRRIRKTSVEAFNAFNALTDLGKRQRVVWDAIKKFPNRTALELSALLRKPDPNFVRPRISELLELGLIWENGKRKCRVSGRMALTWFVMKV